MATTQLGSAFNPNTQLEGAMGTIDRLAAQIEAAVMRRVEARLEGLTIPAPVVHVASPEVTVSPSVQAPEVEVTNEISLDALQREQQTTNKLLARLIEVLQQPVTKTVERENGLIESVRETRG